MQLMHLPRLRQATRQERAALQALPVMEKLWMLSLAAQEKRQLLARFFVLLHGMEKQLLPYFSKMTLEEFNWASWLLSPELAKTLVSLKQPLPEETLPEQPLEISTLPQALGSAWALLHVSCVVVQLLPDCHGKALDTRLLQQLEDLAEIYCSSPGDLMAAKNAASQTLTCLRLELEAWEDQSCVLAASA